MLMRAEPEPHDEVWKELLRQCCHVLHRALKGSPGGEGSRKALSLGVGFPDTLDNVQPIQLHPNSLLQLDTTRICLPSQPPAGPWALS